jgi:hypothetical protein
MKTTGKIIIAVVIIAALVLLFNPDLLGSGGTPTFNIVTPSYDIQSDISCDTINICTDYLIVNDAPSSITTKCTNGKCVFTSPINPDTVSGGGLE